MRPGDLLEERFEIAQRIGAGGMGEVFRALDRTSGRDVAVKVLLDAANRSAARFAREVEVLEALSHPGIVGHVAHGVTSGGEPYLVMEWLDGEDLQARLERAPLSLRETLSVVARAAEALGAAHARAIVHRDVKPSNVFLAGGVARVVLLDFGVARVDDDMQLTRPETVLGTPGYMAPEQARKGPTVDPRADVFALGAILFQCLTDEPAFRGEHPLAVLGQLLLDEAPRVRDLRPGVPEALDALVARMLARDPSLRPRDGADVAAALSTIEAQTSSADLDAVVHRVPPAITRHERQMLSVVLMPSSDAGAPSTSDDADLSRAAERYGGRVTRIADGSMLVTIAPESQVATDYAARSARCALTLRALRPDPPMALAMGRSDTAGPRMTAAAIDQATRLLVQGATAGGAAAGILLDDVISGLLDGRFEVAEGESGHVLLGEQELGSEVRTLLGKPTACVGRDTELTALLGLWGTCVEEPCARAVIVTGPAGVGKSRLCAELLSRVRRRGEPVSVWRARGDPLRAGSPLGMLGQVLRGALGIREGAPREAQHARIRERVAEHVGAAEQTRVAEFLGELCGAPFADDESMPLRAARQDAQLLREQLRRAFLDFLEAEARACPVLVVLEDLHWGDTATVRYLDTALRQLAGCPVMVLSFARPEAFDVFPKLWEEQCVHFRLRELSRKASARLVRQVLGESVDADTVERLVRKAAGNAFYLEELIRSAAEGKRELPETVLAMVEASLSRLDGEARRVVRAASVLGEVSWEGAVASLLGGDARTGHVLDALVDQEILVEGKESRFPGEREIAFRHALLRDGAYVMLTEEDRRAGHKRAAAWLEAHGEADPAVLGGHFERGGELERAAQFYGRAAEQAISGNDLDGALAHAERGLGCGVEGQARGELYASQTSAHFWRGDFAAGMRTGTQALALLAPGSRPWARCMLGLLPAASLLGMKEPFDDLSRTLLGTEPAEEARAAYQEAACMLLVSLSWAGAHDAARGVMARMQEVDAGTEVRDARARGWLNMGLGIYMSLLEPDPWAGWLATGDAQRYFEAAGDRRMLANVLSLRGAVEAELLGVERAEAALRAGLALVEPTGEVFAIANIKGYLALLLARAGAPDQLDDARALADWVLAKVDARTFFAGFARCALSHCERRNGSVELAEEHARAARQVLSATPGRAPSGLIAHVQALLAAGKPAEARAVGDEALALVEALGGRGNQEIPLRLAAAEARFAAGDREAAAATTRDALAALAERARRITDEAVRAHFVHRIPTHARLAELARSLELDAGE